MRLIPRIVMVATLVVGPFASARQVESWPYERLFKEADVVVIATVKASVETKDPAPDGRWKSVLIGQATSFTIDTVIKGTVPAAPLTVLHFKLKPGVVAQDGPMLVGFRSKGPVIEGGGVVKYHVELGNPQYLLFLKRDGKDRFAPVSGQIDALLSVKEIYAPLPAVMDREGASLRDGR